MRLAVRSSRFWGSPLGLGKQLPLSESQFPPAAKGKEGTGHPQPPQKSLESRNIKQMQAGVRYVPAHTLPHHGLPPARLLCPWSSPGKNSGVGAHFLLHRIFPVQGSNPGLSCLLHRQADSLPTVSPVPCVENQREPTV